MNMAQHFCFACFSTNTWEKRKARKQQFMLHLSARPDVGPVVYVEPPVNLFRLLCLPYAELRTQDDRRRWKRALRGTVEPLMGKLFLYTPLFYIPFSFRIPGIYAINLSIATALMRFRTRHILTGNIVVWLYHPLDAPILRFFRRRALAVFDWAESWPEYFTELGPRWRERVRSAEESMLRQCDIVFTVSRRLRDAALVFNPHSYQLKDGTIPELFANAAGAIPTALRALPRPIVGYVGSISSRVDLELLYELSSQVPQCSLLLVGNNLRSPHDLLRMKQHPHIFYIDAREYRELPDYIAAMDVCLLPYIPALVSSPATKIFDYLAAGKPVVSTDLPEMDDFAGLVTVTSTHAAFIEAVKAHIAHPDAAAAARRIALARANSWAHRTDDIMNVLNIQAAGRTQEG